MREYILGSAPVQHACPHTERITEHMPAGYPHFARLRCAGCGRHLGWVPRPETVQRRKLNAVNMAKLGMCPGLSAWACSFLNSIGAQKKLSPKQQAVLDRLVAQHLGSMR